jgi:hypothetical protein
MKSTQRRSHSGQGKIVLFASLLASVSRFEIRQKEIGGYVALLMDIPSLDELRFLIADFVKSIT